MFFTVFSEFRIGDLVVCTVLQGFFV